MGWASSKVLPSTKEAKYEPISQTSDSLYHPVSETQCEQVGHCADDSDDDDVHDPCPESPCTAYRPIPALSYPRSRSQLFFGRWSSQSVESDDGECSGDDAASASYLAPLCCQTRRVRLRRRPVCAVSKWGAMGWVAALMIGSIVFYCYDLRDRLQMQVPDLKEIEQADYYWDDADDPATGAPSDTPASSGSGNGNDGTLQDQEALILANDPTHVLVPSRPLELDQPPPLLGPMTSRQPLDFLTHFYVTGTAPSSSAPVHTSPLDLVYLFVNASSPFFEPAMDAVLDEENLSSLKGKARHWRDNGELRGALRSGATALGRRVGNLHVVSAAFDVDTTVERQDLPPVLDGATGWRMGQIPEWLDWQHKGNLRWHFHPEIARLPREDDGALPPSIAHINESQWADDVLPTFNSFVIESRVGWVRGLGENFVMSNDDMFMLREMATADWHHPLLGPVHRLDTGRTVRPTLWFFQKSTSGEDGGLGHAAMLLSKRFPERNRLYIAHVPRPSTLSIAHEASVMFAEALTAAARRTLRESHRGLTDIHTTWLMAHLQIERWREALIWSWAVARVGGTQGTWGAGARDEIRNLLGVEMGQEGNLHTIRRRDRATLSDMAKVSGITGWEEPKNTEYLFSSFDGHLNIEHVIWPFSQEKANDRARTCSFSISKCLPRDFFTSDTVYDATDMFKFFAFKKGQECGDCLIHLLINASGERGLSAVLPAHDAEFVPDADRAPQMWDRQEPMLPLTPTWGEADFSLNANVRLGQDVWVGVTGNNETVNLRHYCVKLLSRYAYVYAKSPNRFAMIHGARELDTVLKESEADTDLSILCLNDDQPDNSMSPVREVLTHWMARTFGAPSRWVQYEKPRWRWSGGGQVAPGSKPEAETR